MKKEIMIGGIVVMALTFAMGCGSKEELGGKNSSTYNTVKMETKTPTVIVTETEKPVPTLKAMSTTAPTKTPVVKKETVVKTKAPAATKKPTSHKTIKKTPTSTPAAVTTKKPQATKKPQTTKKPQASVTPTKKPVVKRTATPEPVKTKEPVKEEVKKGVKNVKSMKSIFTTVSLYMAEGQTYDPNEEDCYYEMMYMLANNVGYKCGKNQYKEKGGMFYIGRNAMQALSAAAFADHVVAGDIPKEYTDMIDYNKEEQVYTAYASDAGDVTGKIKETVDQGNGTYTVYFDLLTGDGKEVVGSYEYTLIQNESKYAKISPNFYYRIKEVKKLTE